MQIRNKKTEKFGQKRQLKLWSMAAIPVLFLFVMHYIPMFGIVIAFKDFRYDKGIFGSSWVGLKNFEFFLKSNDFKRVAWNTIYLNFIFIIIGMVCAVAIAILLFELTSRTATKTFQTVLITPYFLSWVVVGYVAYAFLNPEYGWINGVLQSLGMQKVSWYTRPELWPAILTLFSVWKSAGYNSILYYSTLMGIDNTLFEAAEIDGASSWQKKIYITLPCLKQIITIMTLLNIGNIFRADFGLFYQVTRDVGVLYKTTDVMDTYIFRAMRVVGDMSMSSAAGVLQSVVGFITVVLANYTVNKIEAENSLF